MSKTRTLLRLHCKLWAHAFVGNVPMLISSIIGIVLAVMGCVGLGIGSYSMLIENRNPALFVVTMGVGSVLYLVFSAVFPSEERMLDPRMFSSLPLTHRDILPGMVTAMFINSRAAISLVNTIIMSVLGYLAFAKVASAGAGALWVLACVLQLVITLLAGEALAAALSSIASKFSELWGNVAGFFFTFAFLALYLLPQFLGDNTDPQATVNFSSTILGWTPFGAAAGAATDLASVGGGDSAGSVGGSGTTIGIVKGAICIVAILALVYALRIAVRHDLKNPLPPQHVSRAAKGDSLLMPRIPGSPVGALYSREIRYWRRDNRFMMSISFVVIFCAIYLIMGMAKEDTRWMVWFAMFFVALGPQQVAGNSLGMDGPSNWVHIAAGIRGKQIVASRSFSTLTIMLPIWLVICVAAGVLTKFSASWLLNSFLTLGCIVVASAMANFSTTHFPAQTTAPGTNAMKQRNGGSSAFISTFVMMLVLYLSILPGALLAMIPLGGADGVPTAAITGIPLLSWLGVLLHWVIVIGATWFMNRRASRKLDLVWPDIMQKVQHYL